MTDPREEARSFAWLCAAMVLGFAGATMLVPLVPLYAADLGAAPALVGVIIASGSVIPLLLAIPVGSLVDRIGIRGVYFVSAAGSVLAPLLAASFPTLFSLALTQTLAGLAQLGLVITGQAAIAALADREVRERRIGWYSAWLSLGQLVGPLLAGALIEALGFRVTFGVSAALGLALALLSLPIRFPKAIPHGPVPLLPGMEHLRALWGTIGLRFAILMSTFAVVGITAFQTFLPLHLAALGFSPAIIGFVLSLRSVSSILVRPVIPGIVRVLGGRFTTLVCAVVAIGAAVVGFGFARELFWFSALTLLIGFGFGLSQPLSILVTTDRALRQEIGLVLGLRLSFNRLSQIATPVLFGALAQILGFGPAFGTVGAAVAFFSLGTLVLRRRYETEEGTAAPAPLRR